MYCVRHLCSGAGARLGGGLVSSAFPPPRPAYDLIPGIVVPDAGGIPQTHHDVHVRDLQSEHICGKPYRVSLRAKP